MQPLSARFVRDMAILKKRKESNPPVVPPFRGGKLSFRGLFRRPMGGLRRSRSALARTL